MSAPARRAGADTRRRGLGLTLGLGGLAGVLALGLGGTGGDGRDAVQLTLLVPVLVAGLVMRSRTTWVVVAAAGAAHVALWFAAVTPGRAVGGDPVDLVVGLIVLGLLGLVLDERVRPGGPRDPGEPGPAAVGTGTRARPEGVARPAVLVADDVRELARRVPLDPGDERLGTGLLVAELDLLPELADAHGRPAADAALIHVAEVLRAAVRPGDTVARLGRTELAVLMPGVGADAVAPRAEALRRAVRDAPLRWQGEPVQVTVSLGAAHTAAGHDELGALHAVAREVLDTARADRRRPDGQAGPA